MLPSCRCVPPSTNKYRVYAELEATRLRLPRGFAHVVVVPALGEGPGLWAALRTIPGPDTLAILVVNGREDAEAWVHHHNARRLADVPRLWGAGEVVLDNPRCTLHPAPWGALLCVDRSRAPHWLPVGQGVGLARKIGCDVAWAHWVRGGVASPWIHCTDADVALPHDYFAQARAAPHAAAIVYAFEHVLPEEPALAQAAADYEASLCYYVQGLRHAGSPYAFHTIGSTIAVHAEAYAAVRGFPRRNAAEDFYLLNKVRKVGPVVSLHGAPIRIAGRVSQRVPFGTGKALWRLLTAGDGTLQVYHPETFSYLHAWLSILETACIAPIDLQAHCAAAPVTRPDLLWHAVVTLQAPATLRLAHRETRTVATRRRFVHTWFDAFRTLRLVHLLRDGGLRPVPLAAGMQALTQRVGPRYDPLHAHANLQSDPPGIPGSCNHGASGSS